MGVPVVIVTSGGLAITEATNGLPMTEATNGYGIPVRFVASGGLPVSGVTSGPSIQLSAASVAEDAALATVVGALSVINGTGTYTFTLTNSAGGKFVLGGTNNSSLRTAAAFDYETASAHVIAVSATNGVTPIAAKNFTIIVIDVGEGLVPNAPTLVWTSDTLDTTPNFTVDLPSGFGDYRDAASGDVIYLEITDNVAFTTDSTDTLDAGDVSGDIVAMEQTTPLADGVYYARARLKRGVNYGAYSNVESKTITTVVAYVGPGDVKSGAYAWYGLRAYSSASIGLPAIDLSYGPGGSPTHTTFYTVAGGGLDMAAINAYITTAGGHVYVSKIWDQSGNNRHVSYSINWYDSPEFIPTGSPGGKPIMRQPNFFGVFSTLQAVGMSVANPSIVFAAKRTANFTTDQYAYGDVTVSAIIGGWWVTPDNAFVTAGTVRFFPDPQDNATTSELHSFAHVFHPTRANSFAYVNSTLNNFAGSPGTSGIGATFGVTCAPGQGAHTGDMAELGIWDATLTGPECIALNANMKTYLGF